MAQRMGPVPTHCYTNPSFCLQSELSSHDADLLRDSPEPSPSPPPPPPPPQYQSEEVLPPPPPVSHQQVMPRTPALYGETNPAFQIQPESASRLYEAGEQGHRYCYVDETAPTNHRRYASVPVQEQRVVYNNRSRYEYIQDEEGAQLQRSASTRYEVTDQRIVPKNRPVMQRVTPQNNNARYAAVPPVQDFEEQGYWQNDGRNTPAKKQINTPRGRYASLQQEEPPALPDRNGQDLPVAPRNNLATQKLHEILTTPRKPRSRSAERSPRRQYAVAPTGTPQRRAFTPNGSPTRTPNGRPFSPLSLQSSTPTKESSARRCLPLSEISTRPQENGSINYGKLRYLDLHSGEMVSSLDNGETQMRFARMDNADAMSLVTTSPRYQIAPANQQRNGYLNVENAFIAKTAVVPPLSPPSSEANITLMSGTEKMERKNAPLLLMLVGALTCGLALYLSWTQGRRYYFDSAIGCGACCSMAGACQSMRRTWTGLSLAGLSALSCAGLLLLAAKEPRVGTPLHDITAGALCGVSLLGAALALLTLAAPRCKISRHRRVHSWIPHFSP